MNAYSTVRNTGFATIVVAALAGIVSNALAVDQRIIYERDVPGAAAALAVPAGQPAGRRPAERRTGGAA